MGFDLLARVITGVILAGGVLTLLWWGPNEGVKLFLGLSCLIGLTEFASMGCNISLAGSTPSLTDKYFLPIVGTAAFASWTVAPAHSLLTAALAVLIIGVAHTLRAADLKTTVEQTGWNVLGLFYVAGLLAAAAAIIADSGPQTTPRVLFLAFLGAISAGDTMAYFTGKAVGKRPLAPKLSPKKTIEGSIGGLIGSAAAVVAVSVGFQTDLGALPILVATALIGGAAAQIGDLFESLLKRTAGVKDSGSILPGHGGVLDRVDGILFGAPVFLLYQALIF